VNGEHGEIREYRPAVVGYRERKIHKLEQVLVGLSEVLKNFFDPRTLDSWQYFSKELEIQKAYLQHESATAV